MKDTEQHVLCLFHEGPMHGTMMSLPAGVEVVSISEPMQLVCASASDDDEAPNDLIFIEHVYRNEGKQIEGHMLFVHQPYRSIA